MALTKVDKSVSSTPGIVDSSNATAITIDSSERVMIGTTDPGYPDYGDSLTLGDVDGGGGNAGMTIRSGTGSYGTFYFSDATGTAAGTYAGKMQYNHSDNTLIFAAGSTDFLKLTSQGTLNFTAATTFSGQGDSLIGLHSNNYMYIYGGSAGLILHDNSGGSNRILIRDTGTMEFQTGGSERVRIDSSGNVLFGKTGLDTGTVGTEIKTGLVNITNTGAQCITINRLNSNGSLILFQQDNTTEGSISVSGTNVSYNGFTGTHESSGIASDTAIGTVCSTIDELDTYVSGNKEGQTRTDHAKIKVSDTVGDARVYGVLFSYSETDNKPIVASVGVSSVLVTGACEGGDLLESNGDGTAKVQDDDVVRTKTIGKVTIGNSNTDVKLVSCVLYCG